MSQTSRGFTECVVEQAALAWLESLGYSIFHGPVIAPGEPQAERDDYRHVVLYRRLRQALGRLNPRFSSGPFPGVTARIHENSPFLAGILVVSQARVGRLIVRG
jgi:hypothetical protein